MSESSFFKIEQKDHVVQISLNRPEKRNAMNFPAFQEFITYFNQFDEDPSVRVVILKGEGTHFTAGIDLFDLGSLLGDGAADSRENLRMNILKIGQECFSVIDRCRKPVIAAIHGFCIGAGIDLISACDIRIATEEALFGIRETKMGVIADMGTLQRLPYIIGHGWFKELALTGRDFSASEAREMGLITRVCKNQEALYQEADRLADEINSCAPLTVQGTKDVINFSRDNGIQAGLQYVAQKNAAAIQSEDMMEAITAFMEKRKPVFKGK